MNILSKTDKKYKFFSIVIRLDISNQSDINLFKENITI